MFEEFAKIARLSRNCVITEKIDGTNGQVLIVPAVDLPMCDIDSSYVLATHEDGSAMFAGSRTRYIVPAADNAGFAAWVKAHADALWALGPGRHFGEWWGSGIQRGYGLPKGEKRWSLFNTGRWVESWKGTEGDKTRGPLGEKQEYAPECCHVVPVLYTGLFTTDMVVSALALLEERGSSAAPGFMRPEGVVIYHEAARVMFKKTLLKDEEPKGYRS